MDMDKNARMTIRRMRLAPLTLANTISGAWFWVFCRMGHITVAGHILMAGSLTTTIWHSLVGLTMLESLEITEQSWSIRRLRRTGLLILGFGAIILDIVLVRTYYFLNWLHTILVLLPFWILLWLVCLVAWQDHQPSLRSCYPWKRISGDRIVLHYPCDASTTEITAILHGCEGVVAQLLELFGYPCANILINLFLHPGNDSFNQIHGHEREPFSAFTQGSDISMVMDNWTALSRTMSHEISHATRYLLVTEWPIALLEEGLAMYAEHYLCGKQRPRSVVLLPHPLSQLADSQTFFALISDPVTSRNAYLHAFSLVDYLISLKDISTFLRFHRLVAGAQEGAAGRLNQAMLEVYRNSTDEIEASWRCAYAIMPAYTNNQF